MKKELRLDVNEVHPNEIFWDETKHDAIDECVFQTLLKVRDMHHINVEGHLFRGCAVLTIQRRVNHAISVKVLSFTYSDEVKVRIRFMTFV